MTTVVPASVARSRPAALVTGASSGIGRALAIELARAGHAVALAARRADALEQVAGEVRALGGTALVVPCDVTDAAAVARLVATAVAAFGGLDVVIANAGEYARLPATSITRADLDRAFAVNFFGAFDLAAAALPHLLAQRAGHLVLMASFDSKKPMPHDGAYAAAKAALATWAAALRQGVRGSGVHVCTLFPGRVDTPMVGDLAVPAISAKIPAARVARAVLRALRRRSPEVVVPWHCRFLHWAEVLSPRLGDWLVAALRLDGHGRSR